MILVAYIALLVLTAWLLMRYLRGRTVDALIRVPPAGSDLSAVVSTLSYIEHELIKHRIPVIESLVTKRTWNQQDHMLLARTLGRGETSLAGELQRYLDGIQRAAGRTMVNFRRDRAFHGAVTRVQVIQRDGDRWLRTKDFGTPPEGERAAVERACRWLTGPFRTSLIELGRSVFNSPVTRERLLASARHGLVEADTQAELSADEVPESCVARILSTDLDVVVRNLVRNAAQASVEEGREKRVHIDVREEMDETGEESLLIRIHDCSPSVLSRSQIYGREAKRGLGLVTAALSRNQGAVRCVTSDRQGFSKCMEVRVARSLHQPRTDVALHSRVRVAVTLGVGLAAAMHGALLPLVLVPYLTRHPVALDAVRASTGCSWELMAGASEGVLGCELVSASDQIRRDPIDLRFEEPPSAQLVTSVDGASCVQTHWSDDRRHLELDLTSCLDHGVLEPRFTVRFSSLWTAARDEIGVEVKAPRQRLLQAGETALTRGDLSTAHAISDQLSLVAQDQLETEEALRIASLRGWSALLQGISIRGAENAPVQNWTEQACPLLSQLNGAAEQIESLAQALSGEERQEWTDHGRYLEAQAAIWLSHDLPLAGQLLTAIEGSEGHSGSLQSARFTLLALSAVEALPMSTQSLQRIALDLVQDYQRPSMVGELDIGRFTVELVGAAVLFGRAQRAPVPEALCAFRQRFPDFAMHPSVRDQLSDLCRIREVDRIVAHYLRWMSNELLTHQSPLECP